MKKKIFIFAYGSNLYFERFKRRVPSITFVATGMLANYELKFDKKSQDGSGKANCSLSEGKKVYGVIFEIDSEDKSTLDKIEGGYTAQELPINYGNKCIKAMVYIANESFIDNNLKPYDWYMEYIIRGAESFCLPMNYIDDTLKKISFDIDTDNARREKETLPAMNNDNIDMGGFKISEWKALRIHLKNDEDFNEKWEKAVNWYISRLKRRYFNPIEKIGNSIDGVGFSILSIHCILIEHLAAIKFGRIHNYNKRGKTPNYEYRHSEDFFKDFLKSAKIFKGYFFTEDGTAPPFCADDFYKNVRCALLHEACTKNNWLINYSGCMGGEHTMFERDFRNRSSKRIYRDVLHIKLIEYLNTIIVDIKSDKVMRYNFARKMDSLCEIIADPLNYDWWVDV